MKHAAIVVVAVVLVAGVWLVASRARGGAAPAGAATRDAAQSAGSAASLIAEQAETKTSAEAETTTSPRAPAMIDRERVSTPVAEAAGAVTLRGRCVDAETRAPLAGCEVALRGRPGMPLEEYEREHGAVVWTDPAAQTTAADGTFTCTFTPPPPFRFSLWLNAPGRLSRAAWWPRLEAGEIDLGDIPMDLGGGVTGVVVDTHGAAQQSVYVRFRAPERGERNGLQPLTETAARTGTDGSFHLRAAPGNWLVSVDERRVVDPKQVTVSRDRGDVSLTITTKALDEIEAITGILVDDLDAPIAGATVEADFASTAETERDGSFRVERPTSGAGDPVTLRCHKRGGKHEDLTTGATYARGTAGLRLVMPRRLTAEIVVLDAQSGAAIEDYGVRCFPIERNVWRADDYELLAKGKHTGGKVSLDVVSRGRNALVVVPDDCAFDETHVVEFDSAELGAAPMRIALSRVVAVRVRVRTILAAPIADANVELLRPWPDRTVDLETRVLSPSKLMGICGGKRALRVDAGKTDAEGVVELLGPPDAELVLRVTAAGHRSSLRDDVVLLAGAEIAVALGGGR